MRAGFNHISRPYTYLAIGAGLVVCLVLVVVAFALSDKQTINVFPTEVTTDGWLNERAVLEQVLGGQALVDDFDTTNSAYVSFDREPDAHHTPTQDHENTSNPVVDTQGAWGNESDDGRATTTDSGVPESESDVQDTTQTETTPEADADPVPEEVDISEPANNIEQATDDPDAASNVSTDADESSSPIVPMPDVSMGEYLHDVVRTGILRHVYAQEVSEELTDSTPYEEQVVEPVDVEESDTQVPQDAPVDESVSEAPAEIVSEEADVSLDTDSPPEVIEETTTNTGIDVRVCSVMSIECHTIEVSGFDIGSVLSDETVLSYELHASFGARSEQDRFTDDKVLVRYWYRGKWHLAGEIAIDNETSNFTNGGHFTFQLPNLSGWDALRDFRVEFEFIRASAVRTEAYLDGVWVETTYREETDKPPQFPDNVKEDLAQLEASKRGDVFKYGDATIPLPISGEMGGDVVIHANTDVLTSPGTEDVYLSITNVSNESREFNFAFTMPDTESEPVEVDQWMFNIPEEQTIEETGSIAHYCESGWRMVEDPALGTYACADTTEDRPCDELNADGTNCIDHNAFIGTSQTLNYVTGWSQKQIHESEDDASEEGIIAKIKKWFTFSEEEEKYTGRVFRTDDMFTVAPSQTLYFKVRMSYPKLSKGGFAVQATTDTGTASLDLGWRSEWRYRLPITFDGNTDQQELRMTLTRDTEPHVFEHVSDWGAVRIREQHLLDSSWLPYTYTLIDTDTVEFLIDTSTLQDSGGVYLYYGAENVKGLDVFKNAGVSIPEASFDVANDVVNDVEGTSHTFRYSVEESEEIVVETEPSHRLLSGISQEGTLTDDGALTFAYRTKTLSRTRDGYATILDEDDFAVEDAVLTHESGEEIHTKLRRGVANEWVLETGMNERAFKPGVYTLTVRTVEGDRAYEEVQTFVWGVLTWNSTKTAYTPGDLVTMEIGALSDTGHTLCNANLRLRIRDVQGLDTVVPVVQSRECNGNNVVAVPDYTATYMVQDVGTYDVLLEMLDSEGSTVLHSIAETIVVEPQTPYVIERIGPTRIYPVVTYDMVLRVGSVDGFVGTVQEVVPASFELTSVGDARTISQEDITYLEWDVALAPGEYSELSYTFDAPDISPYVFRLGPASLSDVFTEYRQWQIASDAVGQMLLLWDDGANIPTGWTCVSCTAGDPFYQKFILASSTYNTIGGTSTHNHSASATVYTGGSGATESFGTGAIEVTGHGHTYTPTIALDTNIPPYRTLRVIRYNSAGEPPSLPTGAIAFFDASVPAGWTRYSSQDGYYVFGENVPGTTGGTTTHAHAITGTTGASDSGSTGRRGGGTQVAAATDAHTHTVTATSTSAAHEPPYIGAILGKLDATSTPINAMIGMWTDEVPSGWVTVSSSSESFANKFVKPGVSYGSTGGTSTHTHTNTTGITTSTTGGQTGQSGSTGVSAHAHSVDVTSFSTASNMPPYATAVFGKRYSSDPLYTQNHYRFYANANAEPPTDPWPVGATNLAENTRITVADYTSKGDVLRIRMSVQVTNATSTAYTDRFKLQYAPGSTCSDVGLVWNDVGTIGSTTAAWRGYNNAGVADGATTSSTTLSVSDVFETYEEENPSASTTNNILVGQDGEWDWVIQHHEALPGTDYCFRMVKSNGTPLSGYNYYPQLITDQAPDAPVQLALFDNEKISSTTPTFTFFTTDPEGDSIDYQIQIDTDFLFSNPVISANSAVSSNAFDNLDSPTDKAPFNSGDTISYTSTSTLSNNTTYWWRVRGKDSNGSGQWGTWSTSRSFTVDTGVTISTWFQTTDEQFDTDTYSGTESNGSDQVALITGSTTGSLISSEIDFNWGTAGNAWGYLLFTDTETSSDLKYQLQYYDSSDSSWKLIPDTDLSGNSTGFDTSPVTLLTLDTNTYSRIRIKGNFTNAGASPVLSDWTIEWGLRVEQPTLTKLFDNEKTGTTTPTFEFYTTDPQGDDLMYEMVWSTDSTFTTGTTSRTSDVHAGFLNTASSTDTSPFVSSNIIRFTVQGSDALTNGTTYWWKVRARDPGGGNAWSEWSESRSFTVDTAVVASTWFQTTSEQFSRGGLFGVTAVGNGVNVATSVKDVLIAYGEAGLNTPRYRIWNGTSWGSEQSALSVGATQYNIITRAHPRAEIYALLTIGTDADVNVQIYEGGVWGNLQEMTTTIGNSTARGADIAFETTSGNLMAVYCDGDADPSYRIYTESTGWSTPGAVNLSSTSNCEWIRLASDPTSNEIILVSLDAAAGQYEAQVWNGSGWGNATVMGSMQSTGNEGMAVAYEESGNQAIVIVSDGNPGRFRYDTWNGTAWAGAATQSLGNDFEWGNLAVDSGSDALAVCYIDEDDDIGVVHWTGSAWTSQLEIETVGNADSDRPVDCVYETNGSRNGYVMVSYSDDTNLRYQSWNGATWSGEASISTVTDSATVQSVRSDDGLVLTVAFDDVNGQFDFSYWNGSTWSAAETLETSPSVTGAPWREPFMMAPRNSAVEGTLYSPTIDFNDGAGPQWDAVTWSDSEPGGSTLTYQVQYYDTASSSWKLVPDSEIPGNSSGTSTGPININSLNTTTYNEIRIKANFACNAGSCPVLNDWTVTWSEGFTVSGIAKQYDQSTNVTSGTVAVAVNGSLQIGKTGVISGGTWTVTNVTAFEDDIITVWVDGTGENSEAVAITRYDGAGPVTGMTLYERHLGIGSDDNPTITNTLLSSFDNSVSGDEDIFFDVDASNNLYVCEVGQPSCGHEQLWIRSGTTYTPSTSSPKYIYTNDIDIEGTVIASNNTFEVSGSWTNAGVFTADTSSVVLSATSTSEIINSASATTSSFYNVTFGQGASTAQWSLASPLDVNGTLTLTSGTLAPGPGYNITIADDLIIGTSGNFLTTAGTTTFDGTLSSNWSDASSLHQDMGTVVVDGTSKTITLSSDTKATTLIIQTDDSLALGGYTLELTGSFDNNGSFVPQSGEVLFTATTTGKTIDGGASSFYDITFNGVGGNWAFPSGSITAGNDVAIANGQVTFPTGTFTVGGSLLVSGGTFVHNNGTTSFTSTQSETITASTSPFRNVSFTGSGAWTMLDTAVTTSGNLSISNGSVTFPSGTLSVGGSLLTTGGGFASNLGLVDFYGTGNQLIAANGSSFYDLTVSGAGGTTTITDTNIKVTNDLTISAGLLNLPTGTLTLSGSFDASTGSFYHSSGTILFATTTGAQTITVGSSNLHNAVWNGTSSIWSIIGNVTCEGDLTLANVGAFTAPNGNTVEVQGTFSNSVESASTTWTGSTLYLTGGTAYGINTRSSNGDTYSVVQIGANTDVSMWNSDASSYVVDASGSLYSQNHAANPGELYIWGSYERTSGTEHWSYATDFDGTDLSGGNERPVAVQFADGASATVTTATLNLIGGSEATTTITNQGSGTYSVTVLDGTTTAQYFEVYNLNASGLSILGSSTVTLLDDAYFELATNGGTLLQIASTTIDKNPGVQFFNLGFATTTAITGTNVSIPGGVAPISYWTFRDHYGNLSGENFDNDPGGNPGNLRWDDSAFDITVSGTVFSGLGAGVPSFCGDATPDVYLKVNGGGSYSAACNGSGVYTIPGVTFAGDAVVTAYLKVSGTTGATVSKTPNGDITDFDIYEHAVIVRHEDIAPMTIANLAVFDSGDDSDMPYSAATGSPNTLTVEPENGLYVWSGKTFTPGGNINLSSGGSGASYDGTLWLAATSTFTAAGTESHSIGGSWIANATSIFTRASSTVTFTATTSGKTIAPASNFTNIIFNGSGGGWSIASSTTVRGNMTVTNGALGGAGDVTVYGLLTGNGTISMSGGTFTMLGGGSFGGNTDWTFSNLIFSTSTATTSTKTGTGDVTILGTLTIGASNTLEAGSVEWFLSGSGIVFTPTGTFDPQTSTTTYNGVLDLTIAATDYYNLNTAPSSGTPTYTIETGNFSILNDFRIGGGSTVTVNANTNDPLIYVTNDMVISSNATYSAASSNDILVGGSYDNNGTFSANAGGIVFNSTDSGETIAAGTSPFHHAYFLGETGGWTLTESATSTGNFSISSSSDWTLASGRTLSVQGMFTNYVGGASTTWTGSTLYLNSGTSYSINTKSYAGDTYGTLSIGANTDVRMWYSTSSSYAVNSSGSLYSQDHNNTNGDLYIWGDYAKTAGNDYWSYATDFDGTDLTGSGRKVDVYIASGSTVSRSGGTLAIVGTSTASTTIANQGSGSYAFTITGGTLNASNYELRNMNSSGLNLSGSPTITSLSDGDLELTANGGSLITVAASVITANPLKIMYRNRFATTSGITGTNVTATGVTGSSWRFTSHYGDIAGEGFDVDPGGDPGYVIWDDSAAQITISGNVYGTNESSISSVCDGSTPVVRFLINGVNPQTTSCNAGTGYYEFTDIVWNVGDVFTVYLDTAGGVKATNVTVDPITNINDMHLYEDRLVVRHEGATPITINNLSTYDSDQDTDILFDADTGSPSTLNLNAGSKLIVWDTRSFAPGGNVSVSSLGSGANYDGTVELKDNASFVAAGTESHIIGGSLLAGTGAGITAANSTFTFTATTTGKTIDTNTSAFANLTFNGSGGAWTFLESNATTTGDILISVGSVTLPTATLSVGGSFTNSSTFTGSTTALIFTANGAETITFGGYDVGALTFSGGGSWDMNDASATTTESIHITNGTVSLPTGTLAVRTSFDNATGTVQARGGMVRLYGSSAAQTITLSGSSLHTVYVAGSGSWSFVDTNATTTGSIIVASGGLTAPSGVLAIGGSLISSSTFNANAGTLRFFATTTGFTINPGGALLGSMIVNGLGGGWTITTSATTTGDFLLQSGASLTVATGTTIEVQGIFENVIGGSATDWTDSTLYLNGSSTNYAVNSKTSPGDAYATLIVAGDTHVSMWNSGATTTSTLDTSSLYSQDDSGNDGNLYIYGNYERGSGSEYWSYATDFDGTVLGGSSRPVNVRIASSSSVTITGGVLNMVGVSGNLTVIDVLFSGAYSFEVSGGTVNAQYYKVRSTDSAGLTLSGTPSITTLNYGEFELTSEGGSMITVSSSTVSQNPSRTFTGLSFSTTTGISSGYNISLTGSTSNIWQFTSHTGNYDGEAYDNDGVDACGQIRWSDSSCLEVAQTHYRFRNDDGGEAAPDSEWFNASWSKRLPIILDNSGGGALTDYAFKVEVPYDSDMQPDFEDIRFTDASGTTSLSYWLESVSLSATATAWVKIPNVPADDISRIFMYYGNALATTSESGTDVFTFFDDFEDGNITEYSGTAQDKSYFAANASYAWEGSYGLSASGGNTDKQTGGGIYQTSPSFSQGSTIRFFEKITAGTDDEPCTLFGVQGSGQNYAVCLDQYPSDKVVISQDVTSNSDDGSATELSSVDVTWGSDWYEVVVDWLTDDSIHVTVYDSSGSVFATTSATDSSYTSGGMGFTFWYQSEGWDFYSVRPYVTMEPGYRIGTEQGSGGATWKSAQDTLLSGQPPNENFRLRFSVENTGTAISGQSWRLQYAPKNGYGACEAVPDVDYNDTPNQASCGISAVCMTASTNITDQESTTEHLLTAFGGDFVSGHMVESPSNQTSSSTLQQNEYTEVEYSIEFTDFATDSNYCFRTTNAGIELDTYLLVAEASVRFAPYVSDWTLNDNDPILLTEGTTATIYATGTISDQNGWMDILYASSTFYRSGVSSSCTEDLNNCYQITSLDCPLSNCSGNSCTVLCSADIMYFAEPTDTGVFSGESWEAQLFVVDGTGNEATTTSDGVELMTLWALAPKTGLISYGTLGIDEDTGTVNASTTFQNTGNANIDILVEGTDMTAPGSSIPAANQKYATSSFTYSSCVICSALGGSPSPIEVDLPKPTSTSTPIMDDLYWGIYVPVGTGGQTHYGLNTFLATGD